MVVIDGMNLVQRLKGGEVTFGEIAATVMKMALKEGSNSGHELQGITTTQTVK